MSEKLKITLWVVLGVVATILLFCLIVVIGCSVNGLKFGEQICTWFGGSSAPQAVKDIEQVAEAVANTPIA